MLKTSLAARAVFEMKNSDELEALLAAYDFDLPTEQLALRPPSVRGRSRLLVVHPSGETAPADRLFADLGEYLRAGDLLVLNEARVSKRRVPLRRGTGARLEALFLSEEPGGAWRCLIRGKRRIKAGEALQGPSRDVRFRYRGESGDGASYVLSPELADGKPAWTRAGEAENYFAAFGETPLPPYLNRPADEADQDRYQTVYANTPGSVAAPTAGLHFPPSMLESLEGIGVHIVRLRLDVGYGTFAPLQLRQYQTGELHEEQYEIGEEAAGLLNNRAPGSRLLAVGTTTLRALESNRRQFGVFRPGRHRTRLFLRPPDRPRTADMLLTNFHLPRSSLLMLVACLLGREHSLEVYRRAIDLGYRFYSYGDAMLILPFST